MVISNRKGWNLRYDAAPENHYIFELPHQGWSRSARKLRPGCLSCMTGTVQGRRGLVGKVGSKQYKTIIFVPKKSLPKCKWGWILKGLLLVHILHDPGGVWCCMLSRSTFSVWRYHLLFMVYAFPPWVPGCDSWPLCSILKLTSWKTWHYCSKDTRRKCVLFILVLLQRHLKSHRATPTLKSISKSSPSPFKKLPMWGVCSTRPVVESSTILSNIHGLVPSCWQRPSRHSMRQLWWGDLYPAIDGFSSHPLSNDGKPKIDNLEDTPCLFTRVRVFSIGDLNHWY